MPHLCGPLATLTLALIVPLAARGAILETDFQSGLDGWNFPGAERISLEKGFDPAGRFYVRLDDALEGTLQAVAPPKFLGDLSQFDGGFLSFDAGVVQSAITPNSPAEAFGRITFGSLVLDPVPAGELHGAVVPLTAAAWGVSQAAWLANLANISRIEIILEGWNTRLSLNGPEVMKFGGFRLATPSTPEPSSLILTGMGLAGLAGWRRRRRGY